MGHRIRLRSHLLPWLGKRSPRAPQVALSQSFFSTGPILRDAFADWASTNVEREKISFANLRPHAKTSLSSAFSAQPGPNSRSNAIPDPSSISSNIAQPVETTILRSLIKATPVLPAEIEIVRLFHSGDFSAMYTKLAEYKAQGILVPASLLTEMAAALQQAIPPDRTREELHRSNIEFPVFYAESDVRLSSAAQAVATHVKYLHQAFALYENVYLAEPNFVDWYIWLCYHTNELVTLQRLCHNYLQRPLYNSKTLSHITNAFIYNYDVEFAKSLFLSIIGMQKYLDEAYLSATLVAFTHVKATYDNTIFIFKEWSMAENCESPYPKTIALLLKQSSLYGSADEIAAMNDIASHLGYNSNVFVQMVVIQTRIVRRDNNKIKPITADDIEEILRVKRGLSGSRTTLMAYYESFIHFFCTYSTMSVVQFFLKEMNKDGIPLSQFAYNSIVTHYISTRKFIPLYKFMKKFLSKTVLFEPLYGKYLFDGFLRAYPYHGDSFAQRMSIWLANRTSLIDHKRLMDACKLKKLASSLNPFAIQETALSQKYHSPEWKDVKYDPSKPHMKLQRRSQMTFRAEVGLREIMRKGITPDYSLIEDTLRNLGPAVRKGILTALPGLRLTRYSLRLQIYDFILDKPDKQTFQKFLRDIEPRLNTSDRILLARRALNKCDYEGFSLLVAALNPLEMTDSRHMILLNLNLRHALQTNNFRAFDECIESFPIGDITLSPFMLKQSRFVEKMLNMKISALKKDAAAVDAMNKSMEKLHGLIGDIEVRLQKDTHDINQLMNEVFEMLDGWVKNSETVRVQALKDSHMNKEVTQSA